MSEPEEQLYAVYAEAEGHDRPLLLVDLTFARLMDDIVVPYETDEAFFIDGVPLKKTKLKRIKLLKLGNDFEFHRQQFNTSLTRADAPVRKIHGEQYSVRFEHLLREYSEDVTSQVIKAFNQVIKPSLKDYLPKRNELIPAALELFTVGVKSLGG